MSTTSHTRKGGGFLIETPDPDGIFTPEDFGQEANLLAQTTREFIDQEVVPVIERLEAQEEGLMAALLRKAGEIGLLCADVPEAHGGLEVDKATSMLLSENLARGGSFTVAHGCHTGIGTLPIVYFGTPEQKQAWLAKLATGECVGAYALTETSSGSDALAAKATARLVDGEWVLNGEKMFITNASYAGLFIVFAKIDGEKFSAFLVPADAPGVSLGAEEKKLGIKGSSTRSLILSDARIPESNLLGEPGRGHVIAFNILNVGRFKLGAGATGAAKVALEESIRWANEREQFGQPLASFPLIQGKLAQMTARIFASESAVYRTAGLIDAAVALIPKEDEDHDQRVIQAIEEFSIECSIIKVFGSEVLDHVVDEAVQIFGGYGYVADYPVERYYRDSRINRIYEGTNEINRMIIPGVILKRALKGELPLLAAAKTVQDALLAIPDFDEDADRPDFALEMDQVENAKKAILLVAGTAAQKYGPDIQNEQEVLSWVADMVIETYVLESAVLRARKLAAAATATPLVRDVVCLLSYEAAERIGRSGREALAHISEGDDLRMQLAGLRRFTKPQPVDTAQARRRVARHMSEIGRYRLP